ncbi:hypothetical protein [Streptomyces sp. NBC_00151]|uniref:hypothetical protein n=1 Tax=Streptomyces sp. NBC_00151 TaxID=2975669 RepID=UPI002DD8E2BB|nr:hypothetical protein [Streptomyces sp. NBC_00151]WRZ44574.1 hypothetical protein OG915_45220 [Streptomyces sp. NBC_00151]
MAGVARLPKAAERLRRSAAWRKKVNDRAMVEVRGCLRDRAEGRDAAREIKAIAEQIISPEYQGRVLIELLQNAHDAHPSRSVDGRVEILLDEDEGEHGVLYVANGGNPFGPKDFKSLCRIGLSGKRLGSVLEVGGVLRVPGVRRRWSGETRSASVTVSGPAYGSPMNHQRSSPHQEDNFKVRETGQRSLCASDMGGRVPRMCASCLGGDHT